MMRPSIRLVGSCVTKPTSLTKFVQPFSLLISGQRCSFIVYWKQIISFFLFEIENGAHYRCLHGNEDTVDWTAPQALSTIRIKVFSRASMVSLFCANIRLSVGMLRRFLPLGGKNCYNKPEMETIGMNMNWICSPESSRCQSVWVAWSVTTVPAYRWWAKQSALQIKKANG